MLHRAFLLFTIPLLSTQTSGQTHDEKIEAGIKEIAHLLGPNYSLYFDGNLVTVTMNQDGKPFKQEKFYLHLLNHKTISYEKNERKIIARCIKLKNEENNKRKKFDNACIERFFFEGKHQRYYPRIMFDVGTKPNKINAFIDILETLVTTDHQKILEEQTR